MSNENSDWICVYKTLRKFDAEAVHGNLLNEGVENVVINKQDAYLNGYVEIHVRTLDKEAAENIINSNL